MKHDEQGDAVVPPDAHAAVPREDPHAPEVQALLRSLRVEGAAPDDLVRRLQVTLAELHNETNAGRTQRTPASQHSPDAIVADLASARVRRRQPWRVGLGLAAAAASAVALGAVLVPELTHSGAGDAGVAASSVDSGAGEAAETGPPSAAVAAQAEPSELPRLQRGTFAADVRTVLASQQPANARGARPGAVSEKLAASSDRAQTAPATCDAGIAPTRRQQTFLARLGGRPVLVVAGPVRASAYACAESGLLGDRPAPILTRRLK